MFTSAQILAAVLLAASLAACGGTDYQPADPQVSASPADCGGGVTCGKSTLLPVFCGADGHACI